MSRGRVIALRAAAGILAAAGVAAFAFGLAAPASAHSTLISSVPAEGATLTTLPA